MRRANALYAIAILGLVAAGARAQAPKRPRRVAFAPLTSLTEAAGKLAPVEAAVAEGLAEVPGVAVVPAAELRSAVKRARRPELETCGGDPGCLAALGKLLGAERVVAGEVGGLGTGQIVYLKVIDVATARETGSTTAVLEAGDAARKNETRSAAYRLLAPDKYLGLLQLNVDVPGAMVYIDGRKMAASPVPPISMAVGTHAVRVTHEQYRDFVRFVDVRLGETATILVPMTAYPVIADEMRGQRRPRDTRPFAPLPWYRRWYTALGVGAGILVGAAVVTLLTADGITSDAEVTLDPPPR